MELEKIKKELTSSESILELMEKAEKYNLSKGDLMNIAYNGNHTGVDSAIPVDLWTKLQKFGGTFWFVMDYKTQPVSPFGRLVHLGEKILYNQSE